MNPRNMAIRISVAVNPPFPSRGPVICKNAIDMIAKVAPAPAITPFINDNFGKVIQIMNLCVEI